LIDRAFLRAEGGDLAPITVGQPPIKGKIFETNHIDYGLPVERESEIPASELPDLELGRRFTMNSTDALVDPLRQSIEVGRRAESPRQSLPFSPLRTPSKTVDFEQIPLNDDYGVFDEPPMPKIAEEQHRRESDAPTLDLETVPSVNVVTKHKIAQRKQGTASKRKAIQLDDERELTNASIQELVRDSTLIMLPKPSWTESCLAESLSVLSIALSGRASRTRATHQGHEFEELVEQIPLQDDCHLGPADYALDAPVIENNLRDGVSHDEEQAAPSARRRRVESEQDENTVPQDNRGNLSSPCRSLSKPGALADNPLDVLALWQRKLDLRRTTNLDEIIPTPAKRRQAADTFLLALVLHSRGLVRTEQLAPYGPIAVVANEQLFSSTADTIAV